MIFRRGNECAWKRRWKREHFEKKKKKTVSFECDDEREKDHRGDDEKTTIKKYAKRKSDVCVR